MPFQAQNGDQKPTAQLLAAERLVKSESYEAFNM
jgi:hypothetical protein